MRTSRIAQETSRILAATTTETNRTTRSSLSRFAQHEVSTSIKTEEISKHESVPTDIEDSIPPPSRKRKRRSPPRTPQKASTTLTTSDHLTVAATPSSTKSSRIRKPARRIKNEETGEVEIHAPADWREVYNTVKAMRTSGTAQNAAVDTMGCERLAQDEVSPKVKRYHTLTALMLSSQTKDTTNAIAMKRLQTELPTFMEGAEKGLTLENILAVDPKLLNELIWVVGFHNNKTKYIKATAEILRDEYRGDVPDTIEGLMSLPGVGPKMAYLCLSTAWGRTEGIGVDVHVHRITNLWGWHKTRGPEETRMALQAWLPRELWHEINWLLVGLGQTICLPVGRKCGECELGLRGLCKAAERSKVIVGRKLREGLVKKDEEGKVVEKMETVKVEQVTEQVPVNANAESQAGDAILKSLDYGKVKEEGKA